MAKATTTPELYGLVLAGGRSTRMGRDKTALAYHGRPQTEACFELLQGPCARVFLSNRADQADATGHRGLPQLHDHYDAIGPTGGILTAFDAHPDKAWLVAACDLPFLNAATLAHLVAHRDPTRVATAYRSHHDGLPEPLCAIYEPAVAERLREFVRGGLTCPRKALIRSATALLDLPDPRALDNVNRPEEFEAARRAFADAGTRSVRVRLYAMLREAVGATEVDMQTPAATTRDLYGELQTRYGFQWPHDRFRVAVNEELCGWDHPLQARDIVSFIPPVAGG